MQRGRSNACLSEKDISDIHAMVANGYQQLFIARFYNVCPATIHRAVHARPAPVLELPLLPKGKVWERNWNQRVIWAAEHHERQGR